MTLIEILNNHQQIKLVIYQNHMFTRFDNITLKDIYNNQLTIKCDTAFLSLYIKNLHFNFDSEHEAYTSDFQDLTYYIPIHN